MMLTVDNIQTMSSREIAELTDKEHKNVLADIRKMLEDLGKAAADFSAVAQIPGPNGSTRQIEVFNLPKRETLILVSGYNVAMRAKIIDRWQQLEADAADPMKALADPAKLRHVLLGYTEKVLALEQQVGELAPKAEALDRFITSVDGSFCLTDAAKALQVQPRKFIAKLQEMGWIYRRPMGTGWLAYQDRLTMGVMEHKVTTGEKSDGTEWASTQVRVTAKGMARLSMIFSEVAA